MLKFCFEKNSLDENIKIKELEFKKASSLNKLKNSLYFYFSSLFYSNNKTISF